MWFHYLGYGSWNANCITLMNFSVAYFREGRFERTCDVQICPRQDRRTTLTQWQGHWRQKFSQNINRLLSYSQRVSLNLLCPAPQKGPTTAPYYWCWMVMLFMYLYGEVTKKVGFVSADSWRVWKSTASLDSVDRTSVSQIQFSFPHENNTLIYVKLLRFSHNFMILPWIPQNKTNQQILLTHISSQMWNS